MARRNELVKARQGKARQGKARQEVVSSATQTGFVYKQGQVALQFGIVIPL
jgi:hypothetical protein